MKSNLNKQIESQKKQLKSLEEFQRIQTKRRKLIAKSFRRIGSSTTNRIVFNNEEKEVNYL